MTDFLLNNAGLLEVILGTEIVVLIAAAFFYQVAKIIAKTDRHDPLVRFYRIFWTAFASPVSSIKELDLRQAEYAARDAGMVGLGDVSVETLANVDAPDLVDLDDAGDAPSPMPAPTSDATPAAFDDALAPQPQSKVQPIGRTGGEEDTRLRGKAEAGPSRELQFMQRKKAEREAQVNRDDDAPLPMSLDDDAPIPITRERDVTASRSPTTDAVPATGSSATSTFDVAIVPFRPDARILGQRDGEILIDVPFAPEDGQANGVIIELMAEQLGVRPYQLALVRGHYKVRKTLQVAGLDQLILDAKLSRVRSV